MELLYYFIVVHKCTLTIVSRDLHCVESLRFLLLNWLANLISIKVRDSWLHPVYTSALLWDQTLHVIGLGLDAILICFPVELPDDFLLKLSHWILSQVFVAYINLNLRLNKPSLCLSEIRHSLHESANEHILEICFMTLLVAIWSIWILSASKCIVTSSFCNFFGPYYS